MHIRSWKDIFVFMVGMNLLLLAAAVPLTKAFEPEERVIDIAIQSAVMCFAICGPVFTFIGYQSMQLGRARDELARLVNRDRLTNVATRDYFYQRMADNPKGYGVSLMVDIDHFKQINDTFGHLVGDAAISRVASLIETCVRPHDIVCRFGGEEFLVFLSKADEVEGRLIAERIRETIADNKDYGTALIVSVTVSIGGSLVAAIDEIDRAISAADEALYRSKRAGRNRVTWDADQAKEDTVYDQAS